MTTVRPLSPILASRVEVQQTKPQPQQVETQPQTQRTVAFSPLAGALITTQLCMGDDV